jgi:hypothetical protein
VLAKFYWGYNESAEFLSTSGLSTKDDFRYWLLDQPWSFPIPANPDTYYPEFQGWGIFLGSKYVSQEELASITKEMQITSIDMYRVFARQTTAYLKIPIFPEDYYNRLGCKFIGFRSILYKRKRCLSCASKWAFDSIITSHTKWVYTIGRSLIPKCIPIDLSEYGLESKPEIIKFLNGGFYEVNRCTCERQVDWVSECATLESAL